MQYPDPARITAAIAQGDARWTNARFPSTMQAHWLQLELADMFSVYALACADGDQPALCPVVAHVPGAPRYDVMTYAGEQPRWHDWQDTPADLLALAWRHYRAALCCELSAAQEEREPLTAAA